MAVKIFVHARHLSDCKSDFGSGFLQLNYVSDSNTLITLEINASVNVFELYELKVHNAEAYEFISHTNIIIRSICKIDFDQFMEALHICEDLLSTSLNLQVFSRDVFFSSLNQHRNEEVENYDAFLSHLNQFVPDIENIIHGRNIEDSITKIIDDNDDNDNHYKVCVYCERSEQDFSYSFMLHPLIPSTYDLEPLYMCNACSNTWSKYRKNAIAGNSLVLAGEKNEELCGLCSASPNRLVMCSKCPRSFCYPCLVRGIKNKIYVQDMEQDDNWECMNCTEYHKLNVDKYRYDDKNRDSSLLSTSSGSPRAVNGKSKNHRRSGSSSYFSVGKKDTSTAASLPTPGSKKKHKKQREIEELQEETGQYIPNGQQDAWDTRHDLHVSPPTHTSTSSLSHPTSTATSTTSMALAAPHLLLPQSHHNSRSVTTTM